MAIQLSHQMGEMDEADNNARRAAVRLRTAMLRAAMTGGALKGGLNLFSLLNRARRKKIGARQLSDAGADTARYVAFFTAFAGVYVYSDEWLSRIYGRQRSKGWRAALAGALAGPTLLLTVGFHNTHTASGHLAPIVCLSSLHASILNFGSETLSLRTQRVMSLIVLRRRRRRRVLYAEGTHKQYGLATYIWMRSLVLVIRCGLKGSAMPALRRTLAPFGWEHSDTGLMMASAGVILSCFILKPDALKGAYASFLDRHGGKTAGLRNRPRLFGHDKG